MTKNAKKSMRIMDFFSKGCFDKPVFDGKWSGKRDSNSRPSGWQPDALPTELLPRAYVFIQFFLSCQQFLSRQRIFDAWTGNLFEVAYR